MVKHNQVGLLGVVMVKVFQRLWAENQGQDIAEYAVMLAVILVIVVGTLRLIGSNANNVFSSVASSIQ
jgi:Flp pilus assembly pilin Flp